MGAVPGRSTRSLDRSVKSLRNKIRETCCDQLENSIPIQPDRLDDLWPLLEQVGEPQTLRSGVVWLTQYRCKRCGQNWEYKRECVGHQDWDTDTYKVNNEHGAI